MSTPPPQPPPDDHTPESTGPLNPPGPGEPGEVPDDRGDLRPDAGAGDTGRVLLPVWLLAALLAGMGGLLVAFNRSTFGWALVALAVLAVPVGIVVVRRLARADDRG
jgi:hypothetical protein